MLLEALSYGLSVLVSDIPSNLEVVSDPAHIFHVGDCEEMRSKLSAMTALKWSADEREAVRRETSRRYDWADIAERTLDVYDELLNRKTNKVRSSRPQCDNRQRATADLWQFD